MSNSEAYLRALLGITARQAFPPSELASLVGASKQCEAYNLCDGTRTQSEIANELNIDKGSFSRTLNRWIELGIALRIADEKEQRPLHLYLLPQKFTKEV